jgi:hypothetical protein
VKCQACGGALAMLFTSSYCPACEGKKTAPTAAEQQVPTALRGKNDVLFVGDDGELWWSRRGVLTRLTMPIGYGPIVGFKVVTMASRLPAGTRVVFTESVDADGKRWSHMHSFHGILPAHIEPTQWRKP